MSLGFTITDSLPSIDLPRMDVDRALFVLRRNAPVLVWNTLVAFENSPISLAQTEAFLSGRPVPGVRFSDLDQVRSFMAGLGRLAEMIQAGAFALNQRPACGLHGLVGFQEALEWGVFRKHQVFVNVQGYVPPKPSDLPALASAGFGSLSDIKDVAQRAVAAFLWLSRTQFFYDCNKRTATLMMVGELVSNGLPPIYVRAQDQELFNTRMREFYETAEPAGMFEFFAETARDMYEEWEAEPAKPKAPRLGP